MLFFLLCLCFVQTWLLRVLSRFCMLCLGCGSSVFREWVGTLNIYIYIYIYMLYLSSPPTPAIACIAAVLKGALGVAPRKIDDGMCSVSSWQTGRGRHTVRTYAAVTKPNGRLKSRLEILPARAGGWVLIIMHGRGGMTIDPRIPTIPGRSASGFHPPGRHHLHQARSAVRCWASRMKGEPLWRRVFLHMDDSDNY